LFRGETGNRGVDQLDAPFGQRFTELPAAQWFGRTHIHHQRARCQMGQQTAFGLEKHVPDDCPGRQHGDHQLGSCCQISPGQASRSAILLGQLRCPVAVDIVQFEVEAGLGQVRYHGFAHVAQADEGHIF